MFNFNPNFYSDVRIVDSFSTKIIFKKGVMENYNVQKELRAFIRVFDGKLWYYTSTSDVKNIDKELQNLYKQGTPNPDIANDPIVKRFETHVCNKMIFDKNSVRNISKEQKIAIVQKNAEIYKNDLISYLEYYYLDKSDNYHFYSSKGSDIQHDYQHCGFGYNYNITDGKEHFKGRFQVGKNYFDELVYFEKEQKEELERSIDYVLHAEPCEKGYFPVVLSPVVAGVFAHESFGHKSEADFMIGDETMRKEWALGKKVGSDILSIYDYGGNMGTGYCLFDDEGTMTQKTYLIRNGALTGRLHMGTTAADLDEDLTGNARAINCKFEPVVRMTSTVIDGGDKTFDELIAGIKDGYYIHEYSHGSGMTQFTIAPSMAFRIRNGKIDKPAKVSVITGNVFETLGLIDGLSKDSKVCSSITGGCGKMEQFPLHVSFGGPYVRISKMNIQ